ncbi:SH3 domain-containing kinase-binding protein 1 isoform X2 [Petromyzon marinus]|uniref:SH3 domain-containing kinase-binding protein 1 isoform X2 n=1 Tax=Petromyzon marinus TaxID=7757 RepID=A0AAJ7U5B3_PETMA|nr:SH3 domain-containing kinase-binding protein 1 isoform X2 [Petromyzon marinus]
MVEVLVEFDYEAQADDELTLHVGDIVTAVRKDSGGWWEGDLHGRRGVFPDNFVKELKREDSGKKEGTLTRHGEKTGNVANLVNRMSVVGLPVGMQTMPKTSRRGSRKKAFRLRGLSFFSSSGLSEKVRKRRCQVAFSYVAQNDDELDLAVGDVVDIIKEVEEGWWEGSHNGRTGVFPSNFVKEVTEESAEQENGESPPPAETSDSTDSGQRDGGGGVEGGGAGEIQPKKIRGFGFGDIFKEGNVKLRPRAAEDSADGGDCSKVADRSNFPGSHSSLTKKKQAPVPNVDPASKPEPEARHKAREYCKALFSYEAQNNDELSLKEGELVEIIAKDCGDAGWWEGEVNGKRGVFPDNFVKLLPAEVEKERSSPKFLSKPSLRVAEDKPKKPPLPATLVKVNLGDKKDVRKVVPDKPERPELPFKQEEKDERHPDIPAKPAAPAIPPKPAAPKGPAVTRIGSGVGPKRPEKPSTPISPVRPTGDLVGFSHPKLVELDSSDKSTDSELVGFDVVVPSPEKLNHPTTNRPKHKGRRPPSQFPGNVLWEMESPSAEGAVSRSDSGEEAEEKQHRTAEQPNSSQTDSGRPISKMLEPKKKPPLGLGATATPVTPPSSQGSQGASGGASSPLPRPLSTIVSEALNARRQPPSGAEPQGGGGGSGGGDDLQAQVRELREAMEAMKIQHKREISQLVSELEEEKKRRVQLQVEVERIKKQLLVK